MNTPGNATLPSGDGNHANQKIGVPGSSAAFGWHSRGYLPHFNGDEVAQHVTFHLADSLPRHVVERLNDEIQALPPEKQDTERRKRMEALLDAGHGSCVLREPALASMVQGALLHFDGQRYRLLEWIVMPNHVHVLFQPINGWKMAKIVASWKKFTARRISEYRKAHPGNATLLSGDASSRIWHREYWDRFIRDTQHFQYAGSYIRRNPMKAGLVAKAEEWQWSSAAAELEDANQEIGVPGIFVGKQ